MLFYLHIVDKSKKYFKYPTPKSGLHFINLLYPSTKLLNYSFIFKA